MRKPQKATFDPKVAQARARGALLGLAVGNAFGTTMRGRRMVQPPFPTLAKDPHLEVTGGGPFQAKPGQVTEAAQLATALAQSLRELKGIDTADLKRRYLDWRRVAFHIPEQIKQVFAAIDEGGLTAMNPARHVWIHSLRRAASSGSLMRTAPIGIFFNNNPDELIRATFEDGFLTHYDPRCQLACLLLNSAIASCIRAVGAPKQEQVIDAAKNALSVGGAALGKQMEDVVFLVQDATAYVLEDLDFASRDDPMLYGPDLNMLSQPLFVRVALRLAFWELHHAPSFEAGILDACNRGGESDTNGAIVGALLGAFHGEEAIPELWKTTVLEALSTRPGPFFELYHPRVLLTLVETVA